MYDAIIATATDRKTNDGMYRTSIIIWAQASTIFCLSQFFFWRNNFVSQNYIQEFTGFLTKLKFSGIHFSYNFLTLVNNLTSKQNRAVKNQIILVGIDYDKIAN